MKDRGSLDHMTAQLVKTSQQIVTVSVKVKKIHSFRIQPDLSVWLGKYWCTIYLFEMRKYYVLEYFREHCVQWAMDTGRQAKISVQVEVFLYIILLHSQYNTGG